MEQKTENSPFTAYELTLLSDALVCAIQMNNDAVKLTMCFDAIDAIRAQNDELQSLNSKICNMMMEDNE